MDANKLTKLNNINYKVRRCCFNCEYCELGHYSFSGFTTCKKHTYQHLKHTDKNRQLSIHYTGYCDGHEWRSGFDLQLHAYEQLKEK